MWRSIGVPPPSSMILATRGMIGQDFRFDSFPATIALEEEESKTATGCFLGKRRKSEVLITKCASSSRRDNNKTTVWASNPSCLAKDGDGGMVEAFPVIAWFNTTMPPYLDHRQNVFVCYDRMVSEDKEEEGAAGKKRKAVFRNLSRDLAQRNSRLLRSKGIPSKLCLLVDNKNDKLKYTTRTSSCLCTPQRSPDKQGFFPASTTCLNLEPFLKEKIDLFS